VRALQSRLDRYQDTVDIGQHFVVPKPQHPETLGIQPFCSSYIAVFVSGMLPTIDLYDQESF